MAVQKKGVGSKPVKKQAKLHNKNAKQQKYKEKKAHKHVQMESHGVEKVMKIKKQHNDESVGGFKEYVYG